MIHHSKLRSEYKVKEGLDFGAWFTMYKRGWGGHTRNDNLVAVLGYGGTLEPYFEKMEEMGNTLRGAKKKGALEGLAEAKKAPRPELISIKEHISTQPDKAFLDWMVEQEKNKETPPAK